MQIRDRLIVVTGASSGIGAATAVALAQRGGRLILVARDKPRLDAVAQRIAEAGGFSTAYAADLGDAGAVAKFAGEVLAQSGAPDVLINNAGAGRWLTVEETSSDELERIMAVPYFAAFNLIREFLPAMRERGAGHIVNVTSVASRLVWPGAAAYIAARRAVLSLSESLRLELADTGIRVTTATFGSVETPYWAHNPGSEERLPQSGNRIRRLTAGEAAAALVRAIERNADEIVRPRVFRLLFFLHAVMPQTTARAMSRGWKR
jgi:short-subunit dehydrogenase